MHKGQRREQRQLIEGLRRSGFFQGFRDAYRGVTGLEIRLVEAGEGQGGLDCEAGEGPTPDFCRMMAEGPGGCGWQLSPTGEAGGEGAGGPAERFACPAGLVESRIPVRVGGREVGALAVGRVLVEGEGERVGLDTILASARERREIDEDEEVLMREAYEELKRVGGRDYRSSVGLLEYFALQLGSYGEELGTGEEGGEPEQVRRAMDYVAKHLRDDFQLGDVARAAGSSPYHLCRIFKASRGMTLTEHVNRLRVDAAKRLLVDRNERVGRVAYEVGYRSLSQFNRAFLRYEGRSPTAWRLASARGRVKKGRGG